ncbi:MAG TPA: hypothetical protein VFW27_11845 [Actinoplanes sp.]|nr:hypothetical protein [Actinoplanes sp.]
MATSWTRAERWAVGISIASFLLSAALAALTVVTALNWHLPGYQSPEYLVAKKFLSAYTLGTVDGLAEAQGYTAVGSPARNFARTEYLTWVAQRRVDSEAKPPAYTLRRSGTTLIKCPTEAKSSEECDTYSNFIVDAASGLLSDFSVNRFSIRSNVVQPSDEQCQDSWCYRLEAGYWSPRRHELLVALSFANNSDGKMRLDLDHAVYYDAGGNSRDVDGLNGIRDYSRVGKGYAWLSLDALDSGGQLAVPAYRDGRKEPYWCWFIFET